MEHEMVALKMIGEGAVLVLLIMIAISFTIWVFGRIFVWFDNRPKTVRFAPVKRTAAVDRA